MSRQNLFVGVLGNNSISERFAELTLQTGLVKRQSAWFTDTVSEWMDTQLFIRPSTTNNNFSASIQSTRENLCEIPLVDGKTYNNRFPKTYLSKLKIRVTGLTTASAGTIAGNPLLLECTNGAEQRIIHSHLTGHWICISSPTATYNVGETGSLDFKTAGLGQFNVALTGLKATTVAGDIFAVFIRCEDASTVAL